MNNKIILTFIVHIEKIWKEISHRLYTNWAISSFKNSLPQRKSVNCKQTFAVKLAYPWQSGTKATSPGGSIGRDFIHSAFPYSTRYSCETSKGHSCELVGWLLFRITAAAFWTRFLSSISRVSVVVDLSREEKIALRNLYKPGLEVTIGVDVRWSVKFLVISNTGLMLSHDSSFTGPCTQDLQLIQGRKRMVVGQDW